MTRKDQNTTVKRRKKNQNHLVFDPAARREFLTGFNKRKTERRLKAREKLEAQVKEARRQMKQEARENMKQLIESPAPLPELEDLVETKEEYELDNHYVTVVDFSQVDLAAEKNFLGTNKVEEVGPKNKEEKKEPRKDKLAMELKTAQDVKKAVKKNSEKFVNSNKILQMKKKLDEIKMKKKGRRLAMQRKKNQKKSQRRKKNKNH